MLVALLVSGDDMQYKTHPNNAMILGGSVEDGSWDVEGAVHHFGVAFARLQLQTCTVHQTYIVQPCIPTLKCTTMKIGAVKKL